MTNARGVRIMNFDQQKPSLSALFQIQYSIHLIRYWIHRCAVLSVMILGIFLSGTFQIPLYSFFPGRYGCNSIVKPPIAKAGA